MHVTQGGFVPCDSGEKNKRCCGGATVGVAPSVRFANFATFACLSEYL